MKIEDLDVFEIETVMFLSFSCLNNKGEDAGLQLFGELSRLAIKVDAEGWCDINRHFDAIFDKLSNKIMVREKNNPPGPYGCSSVLKIVPAELLRLGIIDIEHKNELDAIIDNSGPVMDRENHTIQPDYLRM